MADSRFEKRPKDTDGIKTNAEYVKVYCKECPARTGYCGNPQHGIKCPEMERLERALEWKDTHPSDETIMLILNCIGYEEKSWVEFVRKELEKRKGI